MANARRKDVPADVRGVKQRFERWRSGRQGQERIPAEIWEAAAGLCGNYSVHKVSQWLRLNHTALQRRVHRRYGPGRSYSKPTFVEWSLPAGALSGTSPAEYVVEVGASEALRIHARGVSALEVAALARGLRGKGSGS